MNWWVLIILAILVVYGWLKETLGSIWPILIIVAVIYIIIKLIGYLRGG